MFVLLLHPQWEAFMPKLTPEGEVVAAHMAATTAAFQVLVSCLQRSGALPQGEFTRMLHAYMEAVKDTADPMQLALLDDLRRSLLD
jgi:hypothetical protein